MPNRKRSISSSSSSSSQDSRGIINPNQTELIRAASNFTVPQLVALIQAEHNYARPLPVEKKTRSFATRFLFQNLEEFVNIPETKTKDVLHSTKSNSKKSRSKYPSGPTISTTVIASDENEVDVTSIDEEPPIPYDPIKAKNLMAECEKHVNFARLSDVAEDWEEKIVRTGWTKAQRKLFDKTLKILHADHLARLTYSENPAEPLHRRLSIDKTARAFRCLLTEFNWDTKLVQWLHGQLVDHLSLNYLSAYLDILQTLKAKIPTLIDRMIVLSTTKGGVGSRHGESHLHASGVIDEKDQVNVEALNLLLKRQWDPFAPVIQANKYKKLAVTPVFVVVPSGPGNNQIICSHRQKNILSLLSGLGKVVSVTLNSGSANKLNLHLYCERMLNTSRSKLAEVAASFPNKPIYLVGFGSGAIVAATISQKQYLQQKQDQNGDDNNFNMDTSTSPTAQKTTRGGKTTPNIPIAGVICLAFPLYGLFGSRADIDDPFRNLSHPTLFVIGDRATNVNVTDMELFRRKLKCENALSVICHADDFLRVTNYHQKRLLTTQSYVDKCIIDEITWFIINLPLLQEDLKTQALKEEKEKAEKAAIAAGLLLPPLTTTNLDLSNAANSNIIINNTIGSQPIKPFSRHAKPFYRPGNNNNNTTTNNTNTNNNRNIGSISTESILNTTTHNNNNNNSSSILTSTPILSNVNILNKSNISNHNNSGNLNNSVQIDSSSVHISSSITSTIISTTMTKPMTTSTTTTAANTSNYNITASKLHQQSFTKRKIQDSRVHPVGSRKHSIPISPLARPFPNKLSKDSNSASPFTWSTSAQDCPDDQMVDEKINITSQSSMLISSTPSSTITTTNTSSSSVSTPTLHDGIPTIISSRQKALLTHPGSQQQQTEDVKNQHSHQHYHHQHHSHQTLKQTGVQVGSTTPLVSQQQIYNSGTGSVVTSTNSITNNNTSINVNQQNINLISQNLIPGLPDTTALLTPHPISKPSNSDILRRFEEQQQQFQDHQNKQAVLEAQQKLRQQQQTTTFTSQNSPYLYRLLTPSGPTQHTTFRYTTTNTTASAATTPSASASGNCMLLDRRPLPTRCTDETLSIINEPIPNLYPTSSSSSSLSSVHNHHSYSAAVDPSIHGQINPELFQTLKSTLSVSNNKKNNNKDTKVLVTGQTSQQQQQQQQGSGNNNQLLIRTPSTSNLNSTIEAMTNAGKYTVFASKDRRSLQKTNNNNTSSSETSISNNSDNNISSCSTPLLKSSNLTTTSSFDSVLDNTASTTTITTMISTPSIATTFGNNIFTTTSSTASIPANAIAVILKSSNITSSSSNQPVPILVKSSALTSTTDSTSQPQQIILLAKPIDSSSYDPSKLMSSGGLNFISSSFPMVSTSISTSSSSQIPTPTSSSSSTIQVSSSTQQQPHAISTVYNPQGLFKSKIVVNVNQNSGNNSKNNNNNNSSSNSQSSTTVTNDEIKSKDTNEGIISTTTSLTASSSENEKVIVPTTEPEKTTATTTTSVQDKKQEEEKGNNYSVVSEKDFDNNKNPAPEKVTLISQSSKISVDVLEVDDGQKNQNQNQKIVSTTDSGNKSVLLESKALSIQKKVKVDDKDDKVQEKSLEYNNKDDDKIQTETDKDDNEEDCDDEEQEDDDFEKTEEEKGQGRRGSTSSVSSSTTSSPRFPRSKDKSSSSLNVPTRSTARVKNPPLYSETQLRALNKFQIVEKSEKKSIGRPSKVQQQPTPTSQPKKEKEQEKEKQKPKESDSSNNSLKRKRESSQQSTSKNNNNNSHNQSSSSTSSSSSGKKITTDMERNKATAGFEEVTESYKSRLSRSSVKQQTKPTTENKTEKPKTRNSSSSNSSSPATTTTTKSTSNNSNNNKKDSSESEVKSIELIEIESDDEQDGGRITRNRAKYGRSTRQTPATSSSTSTGEKEQENKDEDDNGDNDDDSETEVVMTRGRSRLPSHSNEPEGKEKKKQKEESKSTNKTKESSGNKEDEVESDDQTDSDEDGEEEEEGDEEEEVEEEGEESPPKKKRRRRRRKQIELMELSTTVNSSRTRKSTTFYGNNIFTA